MLVKENFINALLNRDFILFFKNLNGGFDPTEYPVLSEDKIHHLWVCSDNEFLEFQLDHCTEGERAEMLLEQRNMARVKLWRFFIAYTNTKQPGSIVARSLAEQIKPWAASSKELSQVFYKGVECLDPSCLAVGSSNE
ncbi:hypothetical protein [Pseudoalteromonas obscura]|uniref:Uncharacterized protein n=1 Tax=Pseudoalteromonas obscura TaxID=3048491 RepID=A0ABT7EHA1_9GAMM|nr:hypothetical protein [Pseudoalteromonas sp. P94(2023)]MDK2594415.1 hypothetical protein [Pseudoalteromonas sp. P94(2023)]